MNDEAPSTGQAITWGLVSVAVVSVLSLAGGIIIPLVTGQTRRRWMQFFIAMAVGTLSSDALLHLIPQVLGQHSHSHSVTTTTSLPSTSSIPLLVNESSPGEAIVDNTKETHSHERRKRHEEHDGHSHHHHHDHGENEENEVQGLSKERQTLLKLTCILFAVYALYLFEFIAYYRSGTGGHGHDHGQSVGVSPMEAKSSRALAGWADDECGGSHASASNSLASTVDASARSPIVAGPPVLCGLKGPAVIILFGDGVHNFIDGVAMGVSYATSIPVGIATTIAVLCHELPHELGDMAVLLETGLSLPKALILNLLSALTAFIGLFVGLYAVHIDSAITWLLSITAGMFLYVAWIDMLAHLKHEAAERIDPWWLYCILQFAGFFVGTMTMFLLAWFEHELFSH